MFICMLDRLESGIVFWFSSLSTEKAREVSIKMYVFAVQSWPKCPHIHASRLPCSSRYWGWGSRAAPHRLQFLVPQSAGFWRVRPMAGAHERLEVGGKKLQDVSPFLSSPGNISGSGWVLSGETEPPCFQHPLGAPFPGSSDAASLGAPSLHTELAWLPAAENLLSCLMCPLASQLFHHLWSKVSALNGFYFIQWGWFCFSWHIYFIEPFCFYFIMKLMDVVDEGNVKLFIISVNVYSASYCK